jgi:hypothetical protein
MRPVTARTAAGCAGDQKALDEADLPDDPFREAGREQIEPSPRSRTRSPRPTTNSILRDVPPWEWPSDPSH